MSLIVGNVLVCIAIGTERRLHNVTNYFLFSLALADLFVCSVVMPFSLLVEVKHGMWTWSFTWCLLYAYLDVFLCSASIVHMSVISLDRYLGISKPLKMRNKSRTVAALKIAFVWLMTTIISSPLAVLAFIDPTNVLRDNICVINNRYYMIYGSTLSFLIPFIIMALTFMRTTHLLKKQASQLGILPTKGDTGTSSNGIKNGISGSGVYSSADRYHNGLRRTMMPRRKFGYVRTNSLGRSNSSGSPHNYQTRKHKSSVVSGASLGIDPNSPNTFNAEHCKINSVSHSIPKKNRQKFEAWNSPTLSIKNNTSLTRRRANTNEIINAETQMMNNEPIDYNDDLSIAINKMCALRQTDSSHNNGGESGSGSDVFSAVISNEKFILRSSIQNAWKSMTCVWRTVSNTYSHSLGEETQNKKNKELYRKESSDNRIRKMSGGRVVAALRRGRHAASSFKRRSASMELANEDKASRVLAFVFSSFFICWTPFFLSNFVFGFCGELCAVPEWAGSLFLWLGYTSSTLNPIIYTTFNKRFRQAFGRILRCRCVNTRRHHQHSSYAWLQQHSTHSKTHNLTTTGVSSHPWDHTRDESGCITFRGDSLRTNALHNNASKCHIRKPDDLNNIKNRILAQEKRTLSISALPVHSPHVNALRLDNDFSSLLLENEIRKTYLRAPARHRQSVAFWRGGIESIETATIKQNANHRKFSMIHLPSSSFFKPPITPTSLSTLNERSKKRKLFAEKMRQRRISNVSNRSSDYSLISEQFSSEYEEDTISSSTIKRSCFDISMPSSLHLRRLTINSPIGRKKSVEYFDSKKKNRRVSELLHIRSMLQPTAELIGSPLSRSVSTAIVSSTGSKLGETFIDANNERKNSLNFKNELFKYKINSPKLNIKGQSSLSLLTLKLFPATETGKSIRTSRSLPFNSLNEEYAIAETETILCKPNSMQFQNKQSSSEKDLVHQDITMLENTLLDETPQKKSSRLTAISETPTVDSSVRSTNSSPKTPEYCVSKSITIGHKIVKNETNI